MHQPYAVLLCLAAASFAIPAAAAHAQAPAWPALERQLAVDRVVTGSRLQALIAANQDFDLLRPEEARDHIPVPLWLRVLWRKAHPDGSYSAADPTGGYPLALKEIHEWMLAHQDLLPGLARVTAESVVRAGSGAGDQRISGAFPFPRSESDIRIDPWDPRRVIAASNSIDDSGNQAQYASTDGGLSWLQSELPLLDQDSFHTDPAVDWTSDGTAWAITIGVNADATELHIRLYRSTDAGATWSFDSTISGQQGATDKEMAWIDHGAASPYRDSIYAIWHNDAPVYMNHRRGGAWGTPVRVSGHETTGTGIGGDVKTNAAGVVFGLWPDTGSQKIYLVRSTNGGISYSPPSAVASTFDSYDIGVPAQNSRRALIYVSGGAYRTASKNLVYAAWTDLSGAPGCRVESNEPGANAAAACKTRIWFTRSTDGGLTWSPKTMLNNPAGKNDQFNQALTVDETTGALAVIYYDTVGDATRQTTNVYYQSSFDDGVTWSAPFRVSTAPSAEASSGSDFGNQYGDYNAISGHAGVFFPSWTDRRGGRSEEIWTSALLDAPQTCVPPAPPSGVAVKAGGANRLDVSWQAVSGATEYHVYRAVRVGTAPLAYQLAANVAVPGHTFADTGLSAGTRYFFIVRSFNRCESAPSARASEIAPGSAAGVR